MDDGNGYTGWDLQPVRFTKGASSNIKINFKAERAATAHPKFYKWNGNEYAAALLIFFYNRKIDISSVADHEVRESGSCVFDTTSPHCCQNYKKSIEIKHPNLPLQRCNPINSMEEGESCRTDANQGGWKQTLCRTSNDAEDLYRVLPSWRTSSGVRLRQVKRVWKRAPYWQGLNLDTCTDSYYPICLTVQTLRTIQPD